MLGLGLLLVVALGLGSRTAEARAHLPRFLTAYAGDTLWASLVYLGLVFLRPRLGPARAAAVALTVSGLVELSQLWHPPWLDALRAHRAVALVLGRGFLASDLVCYAVGVALALGLDVLWLLPGGRAGGSSPRSG